MNTLLIIPNIIAVENIDEPPRLNKGKGMPVKGMNPRIVNKFINICTPRSSNKPESKYFSKFISVLLIIRFTLKKNNTHSEASTAAPKKPKFLAYSEKIKSVVWTGTKTSVSWESAK